MRVGTVPGTGQGGVTMGCTTSTRMAARSLLLGYVPYRLMRRRMRVAPFPPDAAAGRVPGAVPVRLAVVGEATAVGYQTVTGDLTLAAQLARRVAQRSGRGALWEAMTTPDLTIRTAQRLLRDNPQLIVADVVVVLLGIGDSLRLTSPRVWRRGLDGLVTELRRHLAPSSVILVAEAPPLELSPEIPARMAPRVGRHVELLNATTRDVLARTPNAVPIPFPSAMVHEFETPDGDDTFYGLVYRAWAAVMAEHVEVGRL